MNWGCSQVHSFLSFSVPREYFPLFSVLELFKGQVSAEFTFCMSDTRRSK